MSKNQEIELENEEIEFFLSAIVDSKFKPTLEDKAYLNKFGSAIINTLYSTNTDEDVSDTDRALVIKSLKVGAKQKNNFIACLCNSGLYKLTNKVSYLKKATQILRSSRGEDLAVSLGNITALGEMLSTDDDAQKTIHEKYIAAPLFKAMHANISQKMRELLEATAKNLAINSSTANNRIVIITSQFIDPDDGVTKAVLDLAEAMKTTYGKDVLIVNTYDHSGTNFGCMIPSLHYKMEKHYSDAADITYNENDYFFHQPLYSVDAESNLASCVKAIVDFAPSAIVTFRSPDMLADLFSKDIPAIYMSDHTAATVMAAFKTHCSGKEIEVEIEQFATAS